ncbi:MAG: hypothetical protein ABJM06_09955 [Gilvibacter sp.]
MHTQTIKGLLIATCFIMVFVSCSSPTGEEIVLNSLDFHGGLDRWEQMDRLTYTKHTILYNSDGTTEIDITAQYEHLLLPSVSHTKIWTQADSINSFTISGNQVKDRSNFKDLESYNKAKTDIDGAFYVIQQPYKFLEDKDKLEYTGQDKLDDSTKVNIVKMQYYNEDGSKDNTWWLYFNNTTNRLEGYMVRHDSTYAYIRNHTYEDKTGLSLCETRTSYRVDSLRNIQYVRGRYRYDFK